MLITIARLAAAGAIVVAWSCLLGPKTRDELQRYMDDFLGVE